MNKEIYKPTILFVAATIIWILAIIWQPFGSPNWVWHIINFIVDAIAVAWFIGIMASGSDGSGSDEDTE